MKNATKLISLVLAVLMMAVALVSCADTGDGNNTTAGPVTTNPSSSNSDVVPTVPDGVTYPGQTINVIASNYDWFKDEIYVDQETGSAIPDAIWKRNDLVKTKLGIEFVYSGQDSSSGPGGTNKVVSEISKQYEGAMNDYSVAVGNSYTMATNTMENLFVDLTDMGAYFDLEKAYWSQGMNDALSIGEAQYLATGPMVLSSYRLIYGTLFNETLFNNHSVELPYDKVDAKEWTVAYQRSIVETFCDAEVDQDPAATYGFIVNHNNIGCDPYLSALKVPLVVKDENNMFKVETDRDRTVSAIGEICDLIYNTRGTYRLASHGNDSEQGDLAKKFSEGTAAMAHLRLMELEGEFISQMEDVYGILPMPLLNSDQDNYYTMAHDQISVVGVPNTRKSESELEMIGAFLDLMAYYSYTEVTPVYYDMCLKGRYFENPRALDMLDKLTEGLYIDPAVIYHEVLGGPLASWRQWIGSNKTSVASSITILGRNMGAHVKKVNTAFEKIAK